MIFHETRLPADDSHEISYLIFFRKLGKIYQNFPSAAVVIGALRVGYKTNTHLLMLLALHLLLKKTHLKMLSAEVVCCMLMIYIND